MRVVLRLMPIVLAMLCGCAVKPAPPAAQWPHPTSGMFLSAHGSPANMDNVLVMARGMDFVLLGESHTNLCDHTVQTQILEGLAQQGHRFSIGLEMLPVTTQPVLDRFNAREFSPSELEREADWEKNWGHSFHLYQPIFEVAARYNLPVVALNLPRHILHAARDGQEQDLPAHERAVLPKQLIPPSPPQQLVLRKQADKHHAMRSPGESTDPMKLSASPSMNAMAAKFLLVQTLWDSTMAEQALTWCTTLQRPMVILAGTGHVEHGWGIAYRIQTMAPTAKVLGLVPVRDEEDFRQQTSLEHPRVAGELLYFYCAAQHRSRLGMNIVFENTSLRVTDVAPDSAADKAGLRPDDILIAAGDKILVTATDLHFAAMAASRDKKPLNLRVHRDSQTLHLTLPLD